MFFCRSTVEFAREVAEQKAIDDAVDKIEDIFGGGSKPSDVVARKGTSLPVTTSTVTSTIGVSLLYTVCGHADNYHLLYCRGLLTCWLI